MDKKHWAVTIAVVIVAAVFFMYWQSKETCGDGRCSPSENCFDCRKDCLCPDGEYCLLQEKRCVKPVCGNKKCEYFENDCCIDCGCTEPGYVCDQTINQCVQGKFTLSDAAVKAAVYSYYKNLGKEVDSVSIGEPASWENKAGRSVKVSIKGQDGIISGVVTEDKEFIDVIERMSHKSSGSN